MNIGIDGRLLDTKVTGINRVLLNIVNSLPQFDTTNKYFLYTYDNNPYKNNFYNYIITQRSKLPRQIYEHYWLNFILPRHLVEQNIDVFFTPYFLVPLSKGSHKNVIVIHDVMTKACGQFFTGHYKKYMDFIVPLSIKRSDSIITISKSSQQDILKYYGVPPEKVHYMHLWTDERYKPIKFNEEERKSLLNKFNLPDRFILFIGAIEERKNISGILKVSDILCSKGIDIKFLLIGKQSFGFKRLHEEIKKRTGRVIYIDYVEEEDIPIIYNLSTLFLFPSYYEGFGLPPLEAMKCGVPVLSSKNSSLIEVVGDGGLLFDASDYGAFAESIISLLNDEVFYNMMKDKAIKQAKKFTPEVQMPKLIDLFNSYQVNI